MKKIIPLLVIVLGLSACSVSTAKISAVTMCSSLSEEAVMCSPDMDTFSPDTPEIFVTTQLDNAPEGTKVTFMWRYLEGSAPEEIDSVVVDSPEFMPSYPNSSMPVPPAGMWPAGKYDVVISLDTDNSDPITKVFTVK